MAQRETDVLPPIIGGSTCVGRDASRIELRPRPRTEFTAEPWVQFAPMGSPSRER